MMNAVIPEEPASRIPLKRVLVATIAALAAVVVANSVLFLIADALGWFPSDVTIEDMNGDKVPLEIGAIISVSVMSMVLAGVVFGLISRFARKPYRVFAIVAVVVFLLSLYTPFTIPDAPAGMVASLLLMHLVAAVVGVWTLFRVTAR